MLSIDSSLFRIVPLIVPDCSVIVPERSIGATIGAICAYIGATMVSLVQKSNSLVTLLVTSSLSLVTKSNEMVTFIYDIFYDTIVVFYDIRLLCWNFIPNIRAASLILPCQGELRVIFPAFL